MGPEAVSVLDVLAYAGIGTVLGLIYALVLAGLRGAGPGGPRAR